MSELVVKISQVQVVLCNLFDDLAMADDKLVQIHQFPLQIVDLMISLMIRTQSWPDSNDLLRFVSIASKLLKKGSNASILNEILAKLCFIARLQQVQQTSFSGYPQSIQLVNKVYSTDQKFFDYANSL